jgi:glycosyltransferase involved in cell wall biosynthesis
MKVSVITVSYNSYSTIRDTIESVLSQDYNNIEYIIIDGGSNDGTLKIIKEYENKIAVILSELDSGIYDAMNKGISLSTGEIIGFLNSDDVFFDSRIVTKIVNTFVKRPEIDVLYGNLVYIEKNSLSKIVRKYISKDYYSKFFEECNAPPHPTFYVKKESCNGQFYFDLRYKIASDYALMFKLLKVNNLKSFYLDEYMIKMRIGGASNYGLIGVFKQNIEIKNIWESFNLKMPIFFFFKKVVKKLREGYKI